MSAAFAAATFRSRSAGSARSVAAASREGGGVGHRPYGGRQRVERVVDVGEVVDVRTVDDGGAEADRLDRVLAAMRHQRAADEGDRGDAVEQPELAERVGDVDLDLGRERLLGPPPRDLEAARCEHRRDVRSHARDDAGR